MSSYNEDVEMRDVQEEEEEEEEEVGAELSRTNGTMVSFFLHWIVITHDHARSQRVGR